MGLRASILFFMLLLAASVRAEDPLEPAEEVVVTAQVSAREIFNAGRSVDIVDEEALERAHPASVPDALRDVPGVHVQMSNAGAGAPFIRGLVGPENLILVDGVRFNNSTMRTGPNQYLSLFDPLALERIEVLHGPGSVRYGSDALGGVVHLTTRDPRVPDDRMWGLSGRLTGATAWLGLGGAAQADLGAGPWRGLIGGSYGHHGELRFGSRSSDPLTAATRAGLHPLSDFERASLRFKNAVDLGAGMTVSTAFFSTFVRDAGRTDDLWRGSYRFYDNDDVLSYLRWERRGRRLLYRLCVNLSHHFTAERQRRVRCSVTDAGGVSDMVACLAASDDDLVSRSRRTDVVHTPGFFASLESRFWRARLRTLIGLEGYLDLVSSSRRGSEAPGWGWSDATRGNFSDGSTYLSLGGFLQAEADVLRLHDHVLALTAGARLSHIAAAAAAVPGLGEVAYRYTGVVATGGLQYRFSNRLNAYLDFSQGFRAPNLQETTALGNTGELFEVPNDALRPVRSDSLEIGLKARIPWVRLHGAAFFSWIDDIFDREDLAPDEWARVSLTAAAVDGYRVIRRINAAKALYKGFEAGASTEPFHGLSAWANLAWIEGDVTQLDGSTEPGRRVPPLSGAGGLRYGPGVGRVTGEVFVRWAARQRRLSSGDQMDLRICADPLRPWSPGDTCAGTPPWWTLNARIIWAATEAVRLALDLENIRDVRYKTHGSGVYAPGFNLRADLSFRF